MALADEQGVEEVYQDIFVDLLPKYLLESEISERVYECSHRDSSFGKYNDFWEIAWFVVFLGWGV